MYTKWCFVPCCRNTSKTAPQKIFVTVPRNINKRMKWFQMAKRDIRSVGPKTSLYCCEDHFNMEEDVENYTPFKLMLHSRIRLKASVVPHIFQCWKTEV